MYPSVAQPLHWMYDLGKMQALVGDKAEIEFHEPAGNPFYRRECGKNTCYGDQAYVLLESLVVCKGKCRHSNLLPFKLVRPMSENMSCYIL